MSPRGRHWKNLFLVVHLFDTIDLWVGSEIDCTDPQTRKKRSNLAHGQPWAAVKEDLVTTTISYLLEAIAESDMCLAFSLWYRHGPGTNDLGVTGNSPHFRCSEIGA